MDPDKNNQSISPTKKLSVFIIDDDQFLLDTYALKFSKVGYDVAHATSGQEALKKLRDGLKPDILLIDQIMPGMTGLELVMNLRKEKICSDATIIMLTNQNSPEDVETARKLNADGYIVKAMAVPSEVLGEVEKIHTQHEMRKGRSYK